MLSVTRADGADRPLSMPEHMYITMAAKSMGIAKDDFESILKTL